MNNIPVPPHSEIMAGPSADKLGKIPPPVHIPVMAGPMMFTTPAPGTSIYTPQIDVGMHMGVK